MSKEQDKIKELKQCKICNASVRKQTLRHHMVTHREPSFACEICGVYKSKTLGNLRDHQRTVHNVEADSVNDCIFCKRKLTGRKKLEKHLRSHTKERPYFCNVCSKESHDLDHHNDHLKIHDVNRKEKFRCSICPKAFFKAQRLQIHLLSHAGPNLSKPHKCNICSKSFSFNNNLQTHIRVHTKEKPYICKICEKEFRQRQHLQSHIVSHTQEQPYACKICARRFRQKSSLYYHSKTAHRSDDLPFKCEKCGKSYVTKQRLEVHMRSHSGERPYLCKICGKRYANSSSLTMHLRNHS